MKTFCINLLKQLLLFFHLQARKKYITPRIEEVNYAHLWDIAAGESDGENPNEEGYDSDPVDDPDSF